jgi:transcriptional regulator with XRE-family HTH domain
MLTLNQEIGRRLQQARGCQGLTVSQAASSIGVAPADWRAWESGQAEIPFDLGVCAAERLGVTPEWLADGD